MARFCLSVRPSVCPSVRPLVRPFVRPTVHRSRMHKPGPVSADDRSHHRVLTAGPGAGEGSRLCGIISPKCDGLCQGERVIRGKGGGGRTARDPFSDQPPPSRPLPDFGGPPSFPLRHRLDSEIFKNTFTFTHLSSRVQFRRFVYFGKLNSFSFPLKLKVIYYTRLAKSRIEGETIIVRIFLFAKTRNDETLRTTDEG